MKTVQIGKGPKSFDVTKYEEKPNEEFFVDWDGDTPVVESSYGRRPGDFPDLAYTSKPAWKTWTPKVAQTSRSPWKTAKYGGFDEEKALEIYNHLDDFEEHLQRMLAFVQSLK